MSRWTGHDHIDAVLTAADAWRERCIVVDGSLFSDESLWTLSNVRELKTRFIDKPIVGTDRNFSEKLKQQLSDAPAQVTRLAAEVLYFLLLFPISTTMRPDTKRAQIKTVWEWSGSNLPDSQYLSDQVLKGVGGTGPAFLAGINDQYAFVLEVMEQWKSLPEAERTQLMTADTPWRFMDWLDRFEHADRRPVRNAILYFLFPDDLERSLSNEHRRQIVASLKHRLPEELRPRGRNPSLGDLDRAISELRKGFEEEFSSNEIDFYRPPIYSQWFIGIREKARSEIARGLKRVLSEYDLELRQCGSKKKTLATCRPVSEETGFWENPTDATNKPLRWFIHLEIEGDKVVARVPDEHGSRRIAFANTAQGTSGAVTARIVPAIKVGSERFVFYETWEWLLLYTFLPALSVGSSGQLFDEFDEATGRLVYMHRDQPYITAALITLKEGKDLFVASELPRPLTYAEATDAIAQLIKVSPTVMPPSGETIGQEANEDGVGNGT